MYPPTIADDHGSRAERTVFRKLKSETPETWVALHSVGLIRHATKPWAEIDFVVVTESGILCLEVKGGRLVHRDGDWFQNDHRLKESPFAQAGGGASALFEYLADRVPDVRRSFVGHGVIFPESRFRHQLPSVEPEMVFDDSDLARPMSAYIGRLVEYWTKAIRQKRGRPPRGLGRAVRSRIVHEIAGDFELVPSLHARLLDVDTELVRLTAQQRMIVGGLAEEPRVVVRGSAGTGKTLLARDEATRLERQGLRTLFICFGSRLAKHVRPLLEPFGVTTAHLHGLMRELIEEAELEGHLPKVEARDLFEVHYPEVALDAVGELGRFGCFDALVIDEGQDLLKPPYVLLFDALLEGELADGTWRLFHDPNQDIFHGGRSPELERLELLAARYRLTQNCRNTREIAMATTILSGVQLSETLVAEGPEVAEAWFADPRAEEKAVLEKLREWIDSGVAPGSITVLSPRKLDRSVLGRIEPSRLPRPVVDVSHSDSVGADRIQFSTVAGFKGLESDAVLLTGFEDLTTPEAMSLLYVGASRARALLGLVLDERCREAYLERAKETVGRLLDV
jgi:hypothetical protein